MLNARFPLLRSPGLVSRTAAAVVLIVAGLGVACSGSPTSPDAITAGRRVQTGSGGGTFCPGNPCIGINGRIEIVAANGTLQGTTGGTQASGNPSSFDVTSHLFGSGRFDDGMVDEKEPAANGFVRITVDRDAAIIHPIWYSVSGRIYEDSQTNGRSSVRLIDDPVTCRSGVLVETTIVANLQNFGRTTIVETHCAVI